MLDHDWSFLFLPLEGAAQILLRYNRCGAPALGGLLLNIGYSLQKLGQDEEAKQKLIESYYAFITVKKFSSAQKVKDYMKETWGLEFKGDI